jgi:GNAT superfamily N-acetyltransferase
MTAVGSAGPDAGAGRLAIRRLSSVDVPGCRALASQRGWLPEASKWDFLLEVGDGFCIDDPDGGLAGAVVVTRYGDELAAIGMLLVSPRWGGRGLGRSLMQVVLDHAGTATAFLYSTAEGQPLSESLGFREVSRVVKFAGEYRGRPASQSIEVRAATDFDLPGLARIDEAAFGARRDRVLASLSEFAALRQVAFVNDAMTGYGAAWHSLGRTVIGPLVGADEATAEALADALAAQSSGPLSLDVPLHCARLARWATEHGLRSVGEAPLMVAGGHLPGDRRRIFAPLMQALG